MNNSDKIYSIVKQIPKGKVLTYKKIAQKTGIKNPRLIGTILHKNTNPKTIPCHRVVRSDGTIAKGYAFGGKSEQIKKLKTEGVQFAKDNMVDLVSSLYDYSTVSSTTESS